MKNFDANALLALLHSEYSKRIAQEWTRPDESDSSPHLSPVRPLDGTISDSGPIPGPSYRNGGYVQPTPLPNPMYMWPQPGDNRNDSGDDYQDLSIPNGFAPTFPHSIHRIGFNPNDLGGGNALTPQHLAWSQYLTSQPQSPFSDQQSHNQLAQATGPQVHIIVDKDGNPIGYTREPQPEIRIDPQTGKVTIHPPKPLKPLGG